MDKSFGKKIVLFLYLIVFVIILLVYLGMSLHKLYVFNRIVKAVDEYFDKDNYMLKITAKVEDKEYVSTAYYRNGIGKLVLPNGSYTWVYNDTAYYVDEQSKVIYKIDATNPINGIQLIDNNYFVSNISGYYPKLKDRIKAAFNPFIGCSSKKHNGIKCYMVVTSSDEVAKKAYLSKNKLLPVYTELEGLNGNKASYEFEIAFNTNKLSDLEMASSKDYTVSTEIQEIQNATDDNRIKKMYETNESN